MGENREILLNVTISNTGEPAYFAWLNLNFSRVFSFVGRADDVTDILCDLADEISINCNLGNPFLRRTETLQFKLVPLYSPRMPGDVMFTTNLTTTSDNVQSDEASLTESKVFTLVRRAEVSIRGSIRPASILYGGQVVGESAIRDIKEIGSKVIHTFHIVNDGPWQADSVNVHIDWPYQVRSRRLAGRCNPHTLFQVETGQAQGKWLLYLTDPVEISPPGVGKCFINPRNINSLGLREKQSDILKATRASASSVPSVPSQYNYKYEDLPPQYNSISGEGN